MKNAKKSANHIKTGRKMAVPLLISFISGLAAFFILISLCSLLTVKQDLSFDSMPFMLMFSCIMSAVVSGFILARALEIKGLLAGSIAVLPLLLALVSLLLYMSGGVLSPMIYLLAPLMLIAGASGGIISANSRRVNFKRKR